VRGPLRKSGPLTDDEWAEMRQHSRLGYGIICDQPTLGLAAPAVLHHHERYDGSGYPGQLCAEKIPLGARIVAVADAFDAMSLDRPYRPAMTYERATAEIARESGRQFDPIVVDLFLGGGVAPVGHSHLALGLAA
jgi:HD-GYP domain-containing protein (c-di-GMP phosphodiesterase class II)